MRVEVVSMALKPRLPRLSEKHPSLPEEDGWTRQPPEASSHLRHYHLAMFISNYLLSPVCLFELKT